MIIFGVDASAEAEVAAQWAVREADLRKADVLLVHAYEVPLVPASARAATAARGRQERQALLDKVAGSLVLPPAMHLDRLIEIDTPEYLRPRLSEQAELTVLGQDHPALDGPCHSGIRPAPLPGCPGIPWWPCLAAGQHDTMTGAR
jgi:nucleotide-binding universal stress UspA family protein